eukprot:jgi/Ulvmu1/8719/UM047_0060.1
MSGETGDNCDNRQGDDGKMPTPLFPEETGEEVAGRMAGLMCGASTVLMVGLADSLGVFKHMAGRAPETTKEVAAGTGLHERWVRELLYQLASSQMVSTDANTEMFWLSAGQADVLANETGETASPFFLGGTNSLCVQGFQKFDRIQEVFRSPNGRGMTYDDYGEGLACAVCRDQAVWVRHNLVDCVKSTPKLHERLEKGATCADLGCGEGEVLFILANAYPNSTFHGYDTSAVALAAAKPRLAPCPNVALKNPSFPDEQMPEKTYDFIITYDAVHDMARPDKVLPIARQALKDDAWGYLVADFKSEENPADLMTHNPLLANLGYGASVMLCLNSGMSEDGGLGLGTLGWHVPLATKMLKEAGFAGVDILDWPNPFNRFFHAQL